MHALSLNLVLPTPSPFFHPSLSLFLLPVTHTHHVALAQGINEISSLPIITTHPQSVIVTRGTTVTLRCEAMGDNQPILFTRYGVTINEADPSFTLGVDSLTIRNIGENLEGEYNCLARNQVGNVTFTVASAPAFVQLRGAYICSVILYVHMV